MLKIIKKTKKEIVNRRILKKKLCPDQHCF